MANNSGPRADKQLFQLPLLLFAKGVNVFSLLILPNIIIKAFVLGVFKSLIDSILSILFIYRYIHGKLFYYISSLLLLGLIGSTSPSAVPYPIMLFI